MSKTHAANSKEIVYKTWASLTANLTAFYIKKQMFLHALNSASWMVTYGEILHMQNRVSQFPLLQSFLTSVASAIKE